MNNENYNDMINDFFFYLRKKYPNPFNLQKNTTFYKDDYLRYVDYSTYFNLRFLGNEKVNVYAEYNRNLIHQYLGIC